MADAQASGACYGNIVWVQVPSPASQFNIGMRGSVGTGRRARLRILWWVHRVGSSPIFRSQVGKIGNRNVSDLSICALAMSHAQVIVIADAESSLSSGCNGDYLRMAHCLRAKKERVRNTYTFFKVEPTGLEPMTSRTSSGRSSQLSYGSIFMIASVETVEPTGLEPVTSRV